MIKFDDFLMFLKIFKGIITAHDDWSDFLIGEVFESYLSNHFSLSNLVCFYYLEV